MTRKPTTARRLGRTQHGPLAATQRRVGGCTRIVVTLLLTATACEQPNASHGAPHRHIESAKAEAHSSHTSDVAWTARIHPASATVGQRVRCELEQETPPATESSITWWIGQQKVGQGPSIDVPDAEGAALRCEITRAHQQTVTRASSDVMFIRPYIEPHNMLVLVADDVGMDRIGAYDIGIDRPPTPSLDALAARGTRFNHVWATPSCTPTRATIMTGRHGFRTGLGKASAASTGYHLSFQERTIPEWLADSPRADFASAAVGKWHLSNWYVGHAYHALDQGFWHYRGNLGNLRFQEALDAGNQSFYNYEYVVDGHVDRATTYLTTQEVDDAIHFVQTLPEPWFIYVAFHAAHIPAHIPPRHLYSGRTLVPGEETEQARYDAVTEALDREIGRLLAHVSDDTTVIFLGDNGTEPMAAAGPYPRHKVKLTMFEGGIRVPMIVAGPQVEHPGSSVDALVHTVDILPTLTELAGVPTTGAPGVRPLDGVSFLTYLHDPEHSSIRDHLYTERFLDNGFGPYEEHIRAVRDERFKLWWDQDDGYQLYDLAEDALEEQDLLRDPTQITEEAERALERLQSLLEGDRYRR